MVEYPDLDLILKTPPLTSVATAGPGHLLKKCTRPVSCTWPSRHIRCLLYSLSSAGGGGGDWRGWQDWTCKVHILWKPRPRLFKILSFLFCHLSIMHKNAKICIHTHAKMQIGKEVTLVKKVICFHQLFCQTLLTCPNGAKTLKICIKVQNYA